MCAMAGLNALTTSFPESKIDLASSAQQRMRAFVFWWPRAHLHCLLHVLILRHWCSYKAAVAACRGP